MKSPDPTASIASYGCTVDGIFIATLANSCSKLKYCRILVDTLKAGSGTLNSLNYLSKQCNLLNKIVFGCEESEAPNEGESMSKDLKQLDRRKLVTTIRFKQFSVRWYICYTCNGKYCLP